MPKHRVKRYIDPKKSVTFEVVARNQVDPLAADETAPKNVLVEKKTRRTFDLAEGRTKTPSKDKRIEEQHKFGIYFDDDYDYLQHLRDVRVVGAMEEVIRVDKTGKQIKVREAPDFDEDDEEKDEAVGQKPSTLQTGPRIILPSSVFPSHVEERVGHLHKGLTRVGPQPDWDPEVMAALEDSESGDELEDDFVALASGGADQIEDLGAGDEELSTRRFYFSEDTTQRGREHDVDDDDMFMDSDDDYDEQDEDDVSSLKEKKFEREETKSRFTSYSLSSSVMTRGHGLQNLDEQFETMFEKEYDECDIGALDGEDIEGNIPMESSVVNKLADQYKKSVSLESKTIDTAIGTVDKKVKSKVLKSLEKQEDTEVLNIVEEDPEAEDQKWDCESILSTYSNTYNRPKVIELNKKPSKIQLDSRGMPADERSISKKALKQLDQGFVTSEDYAKSVCSRASCVSIPRPKDESLEDKKARKQQVKEFRRERRVEKKANTMAFSEEKFRQRVQDINVRQNLQGIKLH